MENTHQSQKSQEMTVDSAIEKAGFGVSQLINIGASSFIFFLELLSLVSDGILLPIIKCQWNLSSIQSTGYLLSTRIAFGLGGVIGGKFGDKIGRRLSIMIGIVFQITTVTIALNSYSLGWYIFFHALNKVSFGIVMPSAHSYAVESCPANKRYLVKIIFGYAGCLGTAFGAYIGQFYEVYSWRFVQLLLTFPCYLVFIAFYLLDSSPRFLMIQGKMHQAEAAVTNMFERNGVVLNENICLVNTAQISEKPGTYADLLRPNLASHSYKLMFLMLMKGIFVTTVHISMPYIMNMGVETETIINFPKNCYSGSSEFYSKIMMAFLPDLFIHPAVLFYAQKHGRCKAIHRAFFVSCASFIASYLIKNNFSSLFPITIGMSLSTVAAARSVIVLYTTELYPTTIRGVASGMIWTTDTIGSFAAPFLVEYFVINDPLFFLLLSGLAMGAAGFVSLKLESETLNKPLAQSLIDLDRNDIGLTEYNSV